MPPTLATPIAVTLPPSDYPYRFTEVVAFRGDFDENIRPGETVNPKGIAYHTGLDRLLVSLSPAAPDFGSRLQVLNTVQPNGTRQRFAPGYQMYRSVESKIAIVPESGPPVDAGFTPGDIFVGRGPQTEISRLSSNGEVLADVFANFGPGGGMWGALAFDTEGEFGGKLIASEANGKIYLVDPDGSYTLLLDMRLRLEGAAIAPVTFGPYAKHLIIGCEGYGDDDPHGGEIFAISANLEVSLLANIGYAAEHLEFIPPQSGTYYQTQLCFDRERENRLWSVSASQFLNRLGRLVIVNEMTGDLWEVNWDAANDRYTQQQVGRVPGRWSSSGFNVQGTELEGGTFAIKRARIPDWNNWSLVPGNFTTDRAPAAASDALGQVLLFSRSLNDRLVYLNRLRDRGQGAAELPDPDAPREWRGWVQDPFSISTPHALACTLHNNRVYAFAVKPEGAIVHKYYYDLEDQQTIQPWENVPGDFLTNTATTCALVNGRLVLCGLSQDRQIFLNEMAPGGRYWSGWYPIPGGGNTDVTPTVVGFQDELYVFIKGLTSKRILLKTRTADGDWSPWAEVPGTARTDAVISAAATEGQLYVFIKDAVSRAPYVNIASETGTWSGWQMLPNPGATDTALAPASIGNRIYLFAKGIDDRRLYLRTTI